MGQISRIAWRNIGRHKRRTMLSALTIGVGLMVFICMDSILSGIDRMSIDNLINLSAGAVKIQTREYDKEKSTLPLAYGLDSLAALQKALGSDTRVAHTTIRTQFLAQLSNYEETMPVIGAVVNETTDTLVFSLKSCIRGSYFSADNKREIIMGSRLAADLGVGLGDNITLYALTKYDSRNADEFKIVGLLVTPDPAINHNGVFLTYAAANDFLDLGGLVTELDVALPRNPSLSGFSQQTRAVAVSLERQFPNLRVNTFLELCANVLEITKAKRVSGMVIMLIILAIAVVGIFNTIFMSVYERIREIGVLRAHGMKGSDITTMFVLEGVITGFLGSLLGLMLGLGINLLLVFRGIPMEKIAGNMATATYGIAGNIYGQWNWPGTAAVFILGILVAAIAGYIPARKAGRIRVVEALRFI